MTILLLDPRWPTLIPMEACGRLQAPVAFAEDIPVGVRRYFNDLVGGEDPSGIGTFVTFDEPQSVESRRIIRAVSRDDRVSEARQVMARARKIGEWEASQTHESLLPYLKEEAAEFAEAVQSNSSADVLCDELGDVFLQVLFHAEIAEDFDLDSVASSFVRKMRSRAPYLFDGTDHVVKIDKQNELWAAGKQAESCSVSPRD